MSSYPPGGDYDERLLDSAPKATRAEKQEGYNVNLLASDNSETPMNARPPTVDGHASLEAGVPPTKESYDSQYSTPWYRQKKWRIIMVVGGILAIGAIVGGAVGGTVANNKSSKPSGPSTVFISSTSTTGGTETAAPLESVTSDHGPSGSSTSPPPPSGTSTGAGIASPVSPVSGNPSVPTPPPVVGPNGGSPGDAPVVALAE